MKAYHDIEQLRGFTIDYAVVVYVFLLDDLKCSYHYSYLLR
jgi:hypothetical protein